MKKILVSKGIFVNVDEDNNKIARLPYESEYTDSMYVTDDDIELYIQDDDTVIKKIVKAGQIIVSFYNKDYPNKVIIIDSPEWAENIKTVHELEQKEKEEWAAAHIDMSSES